MQNLDTMTIMRAMRYVGRAKKCRSGGDIVICKLYYVINLTRK